MSILNKFPLLIAPLYLVLPLDVQAATFIWTATETVEVINSSSIIQLSPNPPVEGSSYTETETFTNTVISGSSNQVNLSLEYEPDTQELVEVADKVKTDPETLSKQITTIFTWSKDDKTWVANSMTKTTESLNLRTTTSPMWGVQTKAVPESLTLLDLRTTTSPMFAVRSVPEPLTLLGASAAIAFDTALKRHKNRA